MKNVRTMMDMMCMCRMCNVFGVHFSDRFSTRFCA